MPIQKVTSGIIADGAIVATDIADGTVTGPKLGLTSINANNIVNASITGDKITVGSLAGNVFTANTITGDKIGQNAVSSNNIIASVTLTTPQLSGNLVSSTNSSIRFVSTNAYNGQQNSKIQWINENQNGVMAQISGIRETNSGAPGALGFYTNSNVDSGGYTPTERMRITSGGDVLIGGTSAITGGLTVYGSGAGSIAAAFNSRNNNYTANRSWNFGQDNGGSFNIYGNNNGSFNSGVSLTWGGTSWNGISDEKLKDIIEPITNGLDKVNTLRTVIGKFKKDEENTRHPFLIAQDVQKVLPEAVTVMNKGTDDECLGLAYTDVIPLLVAAIKELKSELDAAKQRITELENANK